MVLLILMVLSIFGGMKLLLDPHVNLSSTGDAAGPKVEVVDPPINARDVAGIDVGWVSPVRMDATGLVTLALLYILLPFIYLYLSLVEKRLEGGIVGKGSGGEDICLKPEAIERLVTREVRSAVEDVVRVSSCEASQGAGAARVRLSVAVSDRATVPDVQRRVRQIVKDTLVRTIGYADGAQVVVKVTEIAGASVPARRAAPRKKGRRPAPSADE